MNQVRIYDNGGKTADRFTVVYMDEPERDAGLFACLGMNSEPFHPQGIGMHGTAMPGPHLGKRITFDALPEQCRRAVCNDLGATPAQIQTVAEHYLIACIWANCEEGTHPRATEQAMRVARIRASRFILQHRALFCQAMTARPKDGKPRYGWHPDAGSPEAAFGHDLYLSTAGHGVGFRDRDELPEALRDALQAAADEFGEPYPSFYRGWLTFDGEA